MQNQNMLPPQMIVGVDVGGTKIRAGILTPDGNLMGEPYTVSTAAQEDGETIVNRIIEVIRKIKDLNQLSDNQIMGIGLGVTGPIDISKGIILECPQLPTLHFYPLRERIQACFHCPVFMNNDANALILGESRWGAGKGSEVVLGFTLGTGLGCALVINGKLHLGATEMSGEIWPSPYKDGTIEDYVSGSGISKLFHRFTGEVKPAHEIADIARNGDPNARKVWDEFGKAFGFAISWTVNLIDPDIIVVGGSISNSLDLFEHSMNNYFRNYVCPIPAAKTSVVKATLGDNAGFMGSGALVLQSGI
jgi:glucokinase